MEFKLKSFKNDIKVSRIANIHYFEFAEEYHTFEDRHPFRELVYVDSGEIQVNAENYVGKLCDKQLIIHKNNELHSLSCNEKEAPNVIIIGFECACDKLDGFSHEAQTLSNELIKILTEVIKEGRSVFLPPYDIPNIKDMKKRNDSPFGSGQMLRLKLEMFLIELIRCTQTVSPHFHAENADGKTREIRAYITEHYREKITLDDLCFLFNTNKTSICKGFKDAYGDTVINYINKLRILSAKRLMREGELNLTEVSAQVGFSSIHYFSRIFKTHEHLSPKEYIRSVKSKLDM